MRLTERESLLLGDWIMAEALKVNTDPRWVSPWHYALEGKEPAEARWLLTQEGYRLSMRRLMRAIGRE